MNYKYAKINLRGEPEFQSFYVFYNSATLKLRVKKFENE